MESLSITPSVNLKKDKVVKLQKSMVEALRVFINALGVAQYAAYEQLLPLIRELKEIDKNQHIPSILDFKKDLEKCIKTAENLHQKAKIRFVMDKSHDQFEDITYGLFQCLSSLCIKSESEIYQEAIRISGTEVSYQKLSEQVAFFDKVLDKARKSNHDALKMVQERRELLEALNIKPITISDNRIIKVLDIAPERDEVEDLI